MLHNQWKKRIIAFFRRCPLTVLLILSVFGVTAYGWIASAFGVYRVHITPEHPMLSAVLLREYRTVEADASNTGGKASQELLKAEEPASTEPLVSGEATKIEASGDAAAASLTSRTPIPTQFIQTKKKKENSPYYDDPGRIALTTDYPYVTVGEEYYSDALFIGDSRIEGLHDYSNLNRATFYYKEGLTVYDMLSAKTAKVNGKKCSAKKALKNRQFKKIYIMIGINELGLKTTSEYQAQYRRNLEQIRALQPDAVIFIMGVMHVTTQYSKENEVFNNVNINDKNVAAAELANGMDTFYLDMNPAVSDKKGGVKSSYTWDGIHLKAEYYSLWVDFLNAHGLPQSYFRNSSDAQ